MIFWTPDYGAFIVRGAMNAAWDKLGGATGSWAPPVADQTEDGNVITQRFSGGEISWDKQTKKFSTEPANLASGLSGLEVPGTNAPDAPAPAASKSRTDNWLDTGPGGGCSRGIPLLVAGGLRSPSAQSLRNAGRRRRVAGIRHDDDASDAATPTDEHPEGANGGRTPCSATAAPAMSQC